MIIGSQIQQQVGIALAAGTSIEDCLYHVSQAQIRHLPDHLRTDPQEVSTVLHAVMHYAFTAHPEFLAGADTHDLVLRRLLPRQKTDRYIEQLMDEAHGG